MRCVRGTEMLAHARRETTAYRVFAHANLVHMMDAAEIAEDNGDVTVYMVFPVLKEIGQERMQEKEVVRVFLGVCRALEYLHTYRGDARLDGGAPGDGETGKQARAANPAAGSPSGYAPLTLEDADDSPSARTAEPSTPPAGYVHGDVKLANVMLTSTNTPVLLDLGSIRAAHQTAQTRHQALCIQDTAAEHCTMAYRAPELFDVQRGATLDARTDVWALGCLLYALAFGQSPFELSQDSQGASVALAAVNANYRVPEDSPYSDKITRLIAYMLEPDPLLRPFVADVISLTRSLYPDEAS
ncbi:Serine/threonine-protein kinase env7 [Coemansia sp. RSA 2703]|nr:Serine/threonine-protein kinase env7 [Coemansia sp. RSA 2703]